MTTIVEFLAARHDEIERTAKAAPPGDWELSDRGWQLRLTADAPAFERIATVDQPTREQLLAFDHIARHDPKTVLDDIATRRAIAKAHAGPHPCIEPSHPDAGTENVTGLCWTQRMLALPFAGHPDYREYWRP